MSSVAALREETDARPVVDVQDICIESEGCHTIADVLERAFERWPGIGLHEIEVSVQYFVAENDPYDPGTSCIMFVAAKSYFQRTSIR